MLQRARERNNYRVVKEAMEEVESRQRSSNENDQMSPSSRLRAVSSRLDRYIVLEPAVRRLCHHVPLCGTIVTIFEAAFPALVPRPLVKLGSPWLCRDHGTLSRHDRDNYVPAVHTSSIPILDSILLCRSPSVPIYSKAPYAGTIPHKNNKHCGRPQAGRLRVLP